MKFDNHKVKEFMTVVPVTFDPPRKMIVWDDDSVM